MRLLRSCLVWVLLGGVLAGSLLAADQSLWKAGTARAVITPTEPLWMAGYASRTNAADGKVMELWIKVLALEDARGHRAIILAGDLLGFPQSIYQHICAALKEKFALAPDQILLSATHTHCGPVLRGALLDIYPLDQNQVALIEKYSADLEAKIVETVDKALADLAPARVAAGQDTAGFAVNRRNNPEPDVPKLIMQGALKGPVDHTVPVLAVYLPDGKLKAVLFGYACHNTVMDFYKWSGDYAGFAQLALEKSHPEATAMFFMGCGADQNPIPRRKLEFAERFGNMLAAAVEEALLAPPHTLAPELRTTMEMVTLHLGPPPTEAELERLATDKTPYVRGWATRLLAEQKAGKPVIRTYPLPLQAWQFGGQQLLITLGGEPVVDWSLKFKEQFGPQTWVAGYCNDVMNYIPTLRVLKADVPPGAQGHGGYEGAQATIVYGLPAFHWADDVEDLVNAGARRVVAQLQALDGKKAAYVPPPQPVKTTILVGAHNCPLWEADAPQMWEQVRQHPERTPVLGFYDQANPEVADWETKWAVEHGINFFIYCWYRAGKANAVETKYSSAIEALLKSRYVNQFKFTIMWENQQRDPAWGASGVSNEKELLDPLTAFWITNYFSHPSYLKVDNKPVLFVYDARRLAADLGGVTNVPKAFAQMREACRRAGFDGLYLLSEYRGLDPRELQFRKDMGFDYVFAYVWPISKPLEAIPMQLDFMRKRCELNILPEVITVSQGWTGWSNEGPIYRIPPADFEGLLRQAKAIVATLPQAELGSKLLLLDNWNEWSEGHYLAPHREYGFGYLDAVRKVFSDAPQKHTDLVPNDVGLGPYDAAYKARR